MNKLFKNKLPKAKLENIVVQNLKDETLIYNFTTNRAFCLNDTSAKVFNACDGETTFDELIAKYNYTDGIIYLALDGLKKESLIGDEYVSPFAGVSRREVIKKVGLASMVALPVIAGITAPVAAHAASTCTPGFDGDDTNGTVARDGTCRCSLISGSGTQPCNTSRGGQPDPGFGCKQGCLCRVTDPQQGQCDSNGFCRNGTCG